MVILDIFWFIIIIIIFLVLIESIFNFKIIRFLNESNNYVSISSSFI